MSIREYVLLATDGFIYLPTNSELCNEKRREVLIYSFCGGLFKVDGKIIRENAYLDYKNPANYEAIYSKKGHGRLPSPVIFGEVGDDIYITLINIGMKHVPDIMDNHTLHLHGAHVATQLDGFPQTSASVPMWMKNERTNSLDAPPVLTYYFKAENPGTYEYHCHVEASEHIQMGMYGALIVYPSRNSLLENGIRQDEDGSWLFKDVPILSIPKTATNRNFAYNDIHSYFDVEYNMLLSDIDTTWHDSVLYGTPFNPVNYHPNYWLVNGRTYPDTLLPYPDANEFEPNYESYVHAKTGEKILLRFTNLSYQAVPWHIHGWHFIYVAKDTCLNSFLKLASIMNDETDNLAERGFTLNIAVGETYDIILNTDDKRNVYHKYIVNGENGYKSFCQQMNEINNISKDTIAEIPTEPVNCYNTNYINYLQVCLSNNQDNFFPQFYPMHNHEDYKNTNNGIYLGGQITYIQVDKPDMNCQYIMYQYLNNRQNSHH